MSPVHDRAAHVAIGDQVALHVEQPEKVKRGELDLDLDSMRTCRAAFGFEHGVVPGHGVATWSGSRVYRVQAMASERTIARVNAMQLVSPAPLLLQWCVGHA